MAIETELKLRIAPADLEKLKRHPFLRSLSTGRATSRKLYSIYFDTPDLQLHRKKMALRLRHVGNQWIQTLKGGGGVHAGLHQRNEWESPVDSKKLDFNVLESMGATVLPNELRSKVKPLFITEFSRSIRNVQFEGALIEIGWDSGEIKAGRSKHTISELELELKSGDPLQLFRLALALIDIVPLEIEQTSKAEYGYRLCTPFVHNATNAQLPNLESGTSVKVALQKMIWSCLSHLQINIPGAIKTSNKEYLHQIRVALRRLRIVLQISGSFRKDVELDELCRMIAELGTELGRSREWDVFVTEILPSITDSTQVGHQVIARESAIHRQLNHQLVYAALQHRDFQSLLLRMGAWMNGEYWKKFICHNKLLDFAEKVLTAYANKILHKGKCIQEDEISNEKLHKLRIACKNLRYSSELLSSLFSLHSGKQRLKILVKLQNTLGKLNDNTVAIHLLQELNRDAKLENIDLIQSKIVASHSKHLKTLRKEWLQFLGNHRK